jgi:hypothetical protein
MKQYLLYGLFVIVTAVLMIGCGKDDSPSGPEDGGSFTVTISGDISRQFSGFAWFWSGTAEGQQGFVLWFLTDDENTETGDMLWFAREGTTRPGTGTLVIGDFDDVDENGWNPEHVFSWYSGDNVTMWSVSGSMSVTASSANRFAGSFQYTAVGYTHDDSENEKTVTISGNFDAIGALFPGF